jgi:aminopeptidase N
MKSFQSLFTTFLYLFFFFTSFNSYAQETFTRQDTLRGSITSERAWWDLTFYDLDVRVDPDNQHIEGKNTIRYKVLRSHKVMQIELQDPLEIVEITQDGMPLAFNREGASYFIQLSKRQRINQEEELIVRYQGKPKVAVHPPWDGGFTWTRSRSGKPFIATSNQGIGASIWWPNKDHPYDEPDSLSLSITVDKDLIAVGNGRLASRIFNEDGTSTFRWVVSNPINNYGVNVNIGDYVRFGETYKGENGKLDLDYYVLKENLSAARNQFRQVPMMLQAFEHWFGPYPFYEDGFKLVEVPYLGMEHQSSVTYGNGYQNGYRGQDLSSTGWGLKFDFIIIHEAGHEWFANNITYSDAADMWIHEGFTAYSESLYLEYHFGRQAGAEYVIGTRSRIKNDLPVIGPYGVNKRGSGDMYYKGSNLLHMIRSIVDDDARWRQMLRTMNKEFYHRTVSSAEVEKFMSEFLRTDLTKVFDQYLRDDRVPILEYRIDKNRMYYRWSNVVNNFDMPVQIIVNGEEQKIRPFTGDSWKVLSFQNEPRDVRVNPNYYVASLNITGK